jgi:hypothetical protein
VRTDREDPKFLRLPKWAQQRITTLESDVEWWTKKATAGPENSNTFVRHGFDDWTPLGQFPRIEFRLSERPMDNIEVTLVRYDNAETLRISTGGGDPIIVLPSASNSIYVRKERRG